MEKNKLVSFMKFLGFKVNEEDIQPMDAEPEAGEKEMEQNAAPPPPQPAPAAAPVAPAPVPASNLPQLDMLINQIGGFEAFKAILLKVVEAGQSKPANAAPPAPQQNEKEMRKSEVIKLLCNASEVFSEDELSAMQLEVLEKMARLAGVKANARKQVDPNDLSKRPSLFFDYSALGARQNSQDEKVAPRPSFLLNAKK